MSLPIIDQFTDLPITRQRKWQLRKQAEGKCITCGAPAVVAFFCLKHAVGKREYERVKEGFKFRKPSCKTYQLEAQEAAK